MPVSQGAIITADHAKFESTCFYITPIDGIDSEQRKHSDLFMGTLIEPALASFGLMVVRADQIDKPGMITKQIMLPGHTTHDALAHCANRAKA